MNPNRPLIGCLMALAAACLDDGESPRSLRLRGADSSFPTEFSLVLVDRNSGVYSLHCPEGTGSNVLRCRADGADITAGVEVKELTIKAAGYGFRTLSTLPASAEPVILQPVMPFQQTQDYATGLSPEMGLETFLDNAVATQTELGEAHAVKFYIDRPLDDPHLYLLNSRRHPLHYDFVRTVLGRPLSLEEYEAETYRGTDRKALAGTLVYYPDLALTSSASKEILPAPFVLQFFPSDDLTPSQALLAHRVVEERLLCGDLGGTRGRLVYVPAGEHQEQQLAAEANRFSRRGALYGYSAELYAGIRQQILNPGIAYGTLQRLTPEELTTAPVSFTDIVVLARLPNDLPLVGGTITEELQTPLAHVNVAARARGTPNVALPGASTDERVAPLLGTLVRFEASGSDFSLRPATLEEAQAYWSSRAREPWVPTSDDEYAEFPGFERIHFEDSVRFGAKAANLGELRQLLGDQAPAGFAVPFSAYRRFMISTPVTTAGCTGASSRCRTLGYAAQDCADAEVRCHDAVSKHASLDEYVELLLADGEFSARSALRRACLATVEYSIATGPVSEVFAAELDTRVGEVFGTAQVRLRSSTNAEDLPRFSGAGLYHSVSADATGEKRASLRIREVWASVWGWQAFEERQLWSIDHHAVRMGVAVNLAVDDEMANGVLVTQNIADPNRAGLYVNLQLGEISVTNPENGALAEVFTILPAPGGGTQVSRQRFSSLSPTEPILTDQEVALLAAAATRVQARFADLYQSSPATLALDLEFKFRGPERALLIKQARPYVAR